MKNRIFCLAVSWRFDRFIVSMKSSFNSRLMNLCKQNIFNDFHVDLTQILINTSNFSSKNCSC